MIHLYVKTHNVTGLKYFGKTSKNPLKYNGSGKYWKRHIRKHGEDMTTDIIGSYTDQSLCTEDAIRFSILNDIVESPEWANLQIENGLDGAPVGHIGHDFTDEQRQSMSERGKAVWSDADYKSKMLEGIRMRAAELDPVEKVRRCKLGWTEERKLKHSQTIKDLHVKGYMGEFSLGKVIKTEEHKANISKALKGKPKSKEHRENVAFQRIRKLNPLCVIESYSDFVLQCESGFNLGMTRPQVAQMINVGWGAVDKVYKQYRRETK